MALITILFNISFMKYSGEMGVSAFCIAGYVFYIFPSFIMEFAVALITILFNISFMKYSGEMGVSAFCIAGYVFYIFRMLYNGLGQGIQPIVSYNYGEQKFDRVKETYKIGHIVAFVIAIIILIWVNFFGNSVIKLFSEDGELVKMAWHGLSLYSCAIIFVGANFIDISFLQSKDKAKAANILSGMAWIEFIFMCYNLCWSKLY